MHNIDLNKILSRDTRLIVIPRISTVLFIFFQITGMLLYPGGTMYNKEAKGYTFTENFFSDMGAYAARNGDPNYLSMIFFSLSLTIVGVTFILYYLTIPSLFRRDRLSYFISLLGSLFAIAGSLCLIGTGLTPSDLVLESHKFFANNIFYSFLLTSFFYAYLIFNSNTIKKRYAIGYLFFFVSIFIYVGVLNYGPSADLNNS
ncbi:hypothetical protein OAT66_01635, partial [Candidatus Marinimicrobia bacterium]|nr:hypothetical protein [Candidatus Neomarinimicrobiota bacterium]